MPKTLTIHELEPETAKLLMVYARRQSKSLNQSVKDLLAIALGVVPKPRMKVDNGLSRFRGCVDSKDASSLLASVEGADFSKVDKEYI
jgi:hypothetical protein